MQQPQLGPAAAVLSPHIVLRRIRSHLAAEVNLQGAEGCKELVVRYEKGQHSSRRSDSPAPPHVPAARLAQLLQAAAMLELAVRPSAPLTCMSMMIRAVLLGSNREPGKGQQ